MQADSLAYLRELLLTQDIPVLLDNSSSGDMGALELYVRTTIFYEIKAQQARYLRSRNLCIPFNEYFSLLDLPASREIEDNLLIADLEADNLLLATPLQGKLKTIVTAENIAKLPKLNHLKQLAQQVVDYLYHYDTMEIKKNPLTGLCQLENESDESFSERIQRSADELLAVQMAKLTERQDRELAALDAKLQRAQQTLAREEAEAGSAKTQTLISLGSTVLSALLGKQKISQSSLGRATTAARSAGRYSKQQSDVVRASTSIEQLQQQINDRQEYFAKEQAELEAEYHRDAKEIVSEPVRPLKRDIRVDKIGICLKLTSEN